MKFSFLDGFLCVCEDVLHAIALDNQIKRKIPTTMQEVGQWSKAEIAYIRINHSGEVAAQGLYFGHMLGASATQRKKLVQIIHEERDHMRWCTILLQEGKAKPSVFNCFFAFGSLAIGAVVGLQGDYAIRGFIAKSEQMVETHLFTHLASTDLNARTRVVFEQMRLDEDAHYSQAALEGGKSFASYSPYMECAAQTMRKLAGWA